MLVASLATTALAAPAPQAPPSAPSQPNSRAPVVIEPPLVDFGVVAPGSKHPAKFTLRNVGPRAVVVNQAMPSCKCTDISPIAGQTIQPGASIEFTAALSVPRSPGEKDAKVMITFTGYSGMLEAKMKGDVTLPVRVEPAYLEALKGTTSGTLQLTSVDGKPFRVLSAGGKAPMLATGDAGAATPSHTVAWSVQGVPPEQMPQWWVIETDHPDCPLIPVRIRNEATGSRFDQGRYQRFWFVPESIVIAGRVKGGSTVQLETTIEHLNPAAQGRVTNPQWSAVKSVGVPGGEGTAELVSATKRGDDFVDVVFKFTPRADLRGAQYIPVEIETGTGRGLAYVSVAVAP
ncbi:MAG: DUF1573 domain-containing protein [Phycisphaerae bacterium]|nr:DUF1573 domain-containing protein [Phycisphaerae bacterium]